MIVQTRAVRIARRCKNYRRGIRQLQKRYAEIKASHSVLYRECAILGKSNSAIHREVVALRSRPAVRAEVSRRVVAAWFLTGLFVGAFAARFA